MRERHADSDDALFEFGITPAYAGKTQQEFGESLLDEDHPRVCGKD